MSSILATNSRIPTATQEEKPFYGWRYVTRVGANGKAIMETQLLTLEDVLHPREDDVIPENSVHATDRMYLADVFHARESRLDQGLVLCDCMVDWGIKGLRDHSPDVSVFAGLEVVPPEPIGTFHLAPSGGRCLAAIEVVSPHTRKNDVVHKLREYHRAKVPLYVIVDQKKEGGPREVKAYRYTRARYVPVRVRAQGSVLIAALGLRVGLKDNGVVCYEEATGAELGNYTQVERQAREEAQARQAAEQARQAAEQAQQAAEHAQQAAEQARQTAERQARAEAEARQIAEQAQQAAERQARAEAEARETAERQARKQAQARETADQARESADQARDAAEKRVQELEAELRRLREENKS